MSKPINLSEDIEKLHHIASWFDEQEQVDVEEGLQKVKEAAQLIKESKARLKEIENEFAEIQADIASDETEKRGNGESVQTVIKVQTVEQVTTSDEDIPF